MKVTSIASILWVLFVLGILLACGGGSGGGNEGDNSHSVDISAIIGNQGGSLEHDDGVTVEVPEGAIDGDVEFSITRVELPQILPGGNVANGGVYRIESESGELNMPVTVTLPLTHENLTADSGVLGVYKWDGQRWYYTGGNVEDDVISTGVNGFSVFTIGTGRSLHKPFEFRNSIGYNCAVYVDSYKLAHPDIDAPLTGDWGVPVFVPPFDYPTARGVYPQGSYRFCAEYWVDDGFPEDQGWHHVFIGNDGPNFTYSLNENSSEIVPPLVQFDTLTKENPGLCPGESGARPAPGTPPSYSRPSLILGSTTP